MKKPKVTLTVETGPAADPASTPVNSPLTNPPRVLKCADLEVRYLPRDYWNELKGGQLEPVGGGLPSIYIYARTDFGGGNELERIKGYDINWGCCGAVPLQEFEKWQNLCSIAVGMARDLESRLAEAKSKASLHRPVETAAKKKA